MNEILGLNSAVCYKFVTSVTHADLETRPHDCTLAPLQPKSSKRLHSTDFVKSFQLFAPVKIFKIGSAVLK